MGIYSAGRDQMYQIWQIGKTECFAGISREGLTRETLAKTSCNHLSWLFAFQSCVEHMLHFVGRLLTSYPQKLLWSSIVLSLHTLSHTQPLQWGLCQRHVYWNCELWTWTKNSHIDDVLQSLSTNQHWIHQSRKSTVLMWSHHRSSDWYLHSHFPD